MVPALITHTKALVSRILMKITKLILAGIVGSALFSGSLQADVLTLKFDGGRTTDVVDGFNGKIGDGWATAWAGAGTISNRTITVEDTNPLHPGTANYFQLAASSSGSSQGFYVNRRITNSSTLGMDLTASYTISFSTRVESITGGGVYFFASDNAGLSGVDSSNTWRVSAAKDGKWTVGASTKSEQLNMSLVAGTSYDITLAIDPVSRTYVATISNGVSSVTSSAIEFWTTNLSSTGGQYLYFGIQGLNNGQAATLALDTIAVSAGSIPEPATTTVLVGLGALCLFAVFHLRRQ